MVSDKPRRLADDGRGSFLRSATLRMAVMDQLVDFGILAIIIGLVVVGLVWAIDQLLTDPIKVIARVVVIVIAALILLARALPLLQSMV